MAENNPGRLGLGLRPETETLLGFGGLAMSVAIGTYTACQILPEHANFVASLGMASISLLATAYKKEVRKEQAPDNEQRIKNDVIQVKNVVFKIKSQ